MDSFASHKRLIAEIDVDITPHYSANSANTDVNLMLIGNWPTVCAAGPVQ